MQFGFSIVKAYPDFSKILVKKLVTTIQDKYLFFVC